MRNVTFQLVLKECVLPDYFVFSEGAKQGRRAGQGRARRPLRTVRPHSAIERTCGRGARLTPYGCAPRWLVD
jgi:hypothetical protein